LRLTIAALSNDCGEQYGEKKKKQRNRLSHARQICSPMQTNTKINKEHSGFLNKKINLQQHKEEKSQSLLPQFTTEEISIFFY
jgi:hypothetical protein